jgi:hypothetical protein
MRNDLTYRYRFDSAQESSDFRAANNVIDDINNDVDGDGDDDENDVNDDDDEEQGPYLQDLIFFATYEWGQ